MELTEAQLHELGTIRECSLFPASGSTSVKRGLIEAAAAVPYPLLNATGAYSLTPHNTLNREELLSPLFSGEENGGTERLCDLLKVT